MPELSKLFSLKRDKSVEIDHYASRYGEINVARVKLLNSILSILYANSAESGLVEKTEKIVVISGAAIKDGEFKKQAKTGP